MSILSLPVTEDFAPRRPFTREELQRALTLGLFSPTEALEIHNGTLVYCGTQRERLWAGEEYDRATHLGFWDSDERHELLEGEIILKMTQEPPHASGVSAATDAMRSAFPKGYHVRVQAPLSLGRNSRPEPDVAVVTGFWRDYSTAHPTTAVLVIEVADSTLQKDRRAKVPIYAKAGIPEYWILNLPDRQLEVYRTPISAPNGYTYTDVQTYSEAESLSPLAAPDTTIAIADLLP